MPKILLNSVARLPGGTASAITLGTVYITSPAVPGTGESVMVDVITLGTVQVPFGVPVLPAELDTSRPTGWDTATPDYTPADGDALATAITSALAASGTQVIELTAGSDYTTASAPAFTIGAKTDSSPIVIRTSAYDTTLPAEGTRITDATGMARLWNSGTKKSVIKFDSTVKHVHLIGVEIESTYAGTDVQYNFCGITDAPNSNIIIDQCYIHANPEGNQFDGVLVRGSKSFGIVDSRIDDVVLHQGAGENHGISLVDCQGPLKIENCYISASGICVLTGGTGIQTSTYGCADYVVRGNYFFKDTAWMSATGTGPNAGLTPKVKNLFELKECNRCLFEGNVLRNSWNDAAGGGCMTITPRDFDLIDLTIRYNVTNAGTQVPDNSKSTSGGAAAANGNITRTLREHNIYFNSSTTNAYNITTGSPTNTVTDMTTRHCTWVGDQALVANNSAPRFDGASGRGQFCYNWTFSDCIAEYGYSLQYANSGSGRGTTALDAACGDTWTCTNNVWFDSPGSFANGDPPNTSHESNITGIDFSNTAFTDVSHFALGAGSSYKNGASDGTDIGCDTTLIAAAINDDPFA